MWLLYLLPAKENQLLDYLVVFVETLTITVHGFCHAVEHFFGLQALVSPKASALALIALSKCGASAGFYHQLMSQRCLRVVSNFEVSVRIFVVAQFYLCLQVAQTVPAKSTTISIIDQIFLNKREAKHTAGLLSGSIAIKFV